MKLPSLKYIRKLAEDPSLAVIPIATAAKALGLTRGSIERMLGDGRLEEIIVGNTRCVRANGVIQRVQQLDAKVKIVGKRLKRVASMRDSVTYGPIMDEVELDSTLSLDRNCIAKILDVVSRESDEANGILLSVLVHRKTGDKMPGPGFFKMAKTLGYNWTNKADFVQEQTDQVWKHYGKDSVPA
jgi:hypothetical protein